MIGRFQVAWVGLTLLSGCVMAPPSGPRAVVMPAPGKSIETFAAEDQYCRGYAQQVTAASPREAGVQEMAGGAVVGTMLGALAGAALGGRDGAAAGAGVGLVTGTVVGAEQGTQMAGEVQQRYDTAYQQCMYTRGNQLPQLQTGGGRQIYVPQAAPATGSIPPPPPGMPPPPPPGYR